MSIGNREVAMPPLGSDRKKGAGSIRERSAVRHGLRYYDKPTRRQAVGALLAAGR